MKLNNLKQNQKLKTIRTEMKLKSIINLHGRTKLKKNQTLIPKILRIYNKFAWKDKIEINQNFDNEKIKDFKPVWKFKDWGPK